LAFLSQNTPLYLAVFGKISIFAIKQQSCIMNECKKYTNNAPNIVLDR